VRSDHFASFETVFMREYDRFTGPMELLEEPLDKPEVGGFAVHLENFDGPFDLLLQLISRHKMDVTEVALSDSYR
jgi:segregation and condensation protein A